MEEINSRLLELIESELQSCEEPNYYKTIPLEQYTFSTKITLDFLIEKYGGFIYRFDDKVTLLINFTNQEKVKQSSIQINDELYEQIINKVNDIEERLNEVVELYQSLVQDREKNFFSYMRYFEPQKNQNNAIYRMVDEVCKKSAD